MIGKRAVALAPVMNLAASGPQAQSSASSALPFREEADLSGLGSGFV